MLPSCISQFQPNAKSQNHFQPVSEFCYEFPFFGPVLSIQEPNFYGAIVQTLLAFLFMRVYDPTQNRTKADRGKNGKKIAIFERANFMVRVDRERI